MSLPIVILFKNKQLYLAIFFPIILSSYVATGSANAAEGKASTQMDSSTSTQTVDVATGSVQHKWIAQPLLK